ncbi:hypothetical protein GCM10010915_14490 [Microbacterium faecale]|uniref:Uncharacterized protein n=1 Tax=Microbacterium faecale TaxID=1804630 RepID=A0A916Y927_9MICO|nr:hypothetical protein [Microbacterium faecale]GGD35147.1 hypothetical protein GCM10010915_14490 [Microbacterium faecale]
MRARTVLSLLAAVLAAYFAIRGAIAPDAQTALVVRVGAVAIFVAATTLALLVPGRAAADTSHPARMPRWAAMAASAAATTLPVIATAGMAGTDAASAPNATWFVGAGGVVFTIVCARRRPIAAWAGIAVFSVATTVVVGSIATGFVAGLLGSLLWVAVAQLVVLFTDQAYRDTVRLATIQQESASWRRAQESRGRERRERVRVALAVAGPVLTRVIEAAGHLTDRERADAVIAEATLRDELRAARLLDARVRAALQERRRDGSTVTLFDEGGLDDLEPAAVGRVREQLAATLSGTRAAQIIVRTSRLEDTAVTVAGRTEDGDVDLWTEIPRG